MCKREAGTTSICGQRCSALDRIMISPLVSKVNPSHLADFAAHRACFVVEAAPAARTVAPFCTESVQS
jgi:hypothetical protein